jgi:ATP-binding cassette subfamily B protein
MRQADQRLSWWPALRAVSRAEPRLAVASALTTLVCALLPTVFIVLSGVTVGFLTHRNESGLGVVVVVLAVVLALSQVIGVAREGVIEALARRMDIVLRRRLIEAVARPAGVAHLEDAQMQRRIAIAHGLAKRLSGPAGGLLGVAGRTQVLLAGASCAVLLGWVQPVLAAVLTVLYGAVGWLLRREYLRLVGHVYLDPGVLRRTTYLRDVLVMPGAEKEVRVFRLGGMFLGLHHSEWLRVAAAAWRRRRISWWTIIIGAAAFGGGQAVAFSVLASGWRTGAVSTAELIIGVQASIGLLQFAAVTEWDRLAHVGWEAVDALIEIEAVTRPLAGPPGASPGVAPACDIELRDVSFSYPDGTAVLHGVSLVIPAGQSVAIVGSNGAGKSTLLKLLLRSYEPANGQILIDGMPLAELDPVLWRRRVALLSQDFLRLPLSLSENITGPAGSAQALLTAAERQRRAEVAGWADVDEFAESLPHGWETVVSRQIRGGTDLSGGQWQKVALARALYALRAGAGILALDEPTANMDIPTERAVYEAVIEAAAGHTLILVSHRFATVRRADHIVVLDGGRIAESGDHASLLAQGGRYARMFEAQAAIVR